MVGAVETGGLTLRGAAKRMDIMELAPRERNRRDRLVAKQPLLNVRSWPIPAAYSGAD